MVRGGNKIGTKRQSSQTECLTTDRVKIGEFVELVVCDHITVLLMGLAELRPQLILRVRVEAEEMQRAR